MLGIDKEASSSEVRRAWRRLSLKYHPDKVAHKSEEERAKAALAFALLKEANEVLSHEATRREYAQITVDFASLGEVDLLRRPLFSTGTIR